MTITRTITTPATTAGAAPQRRVGRTLTTILGSVSLLLAVGCGADQAVQEAPAALAEDATGSAADVERPVLDIAERTRQRHIENARGSDRHLERSAAAIAEQSRQWRAANAQANDRHLEMLAAELAATSDRR